MFTESLLDLSAGRARRGWSTLVAWTFQSCLVALAVVLPLWQSNAVPRIVEVFTPIGPPPAAGSPHPDHAVARTAEHRSPSSASEFSEPTAIPRTIDRGPDKPRVAEEDPGPPCTICVVGGLGDPNGVGDRVLTSIIPRPAEVAPPPKPVSRLIVSGGVSQGFLLHQVQPVYPPIARTARVEGTVVLAAVISRDGTIEGLHALSGPPMLLGAAIDAVRQWRYRPYLLNGQPVEVETQISVVFTLAH